MNSSRHILLVDPDTEWIRATTEALVPLAGQYRIHALSSLAQAERLLTVEPFDLVLIPPTLLAHRRFSHLHWCIENNVPPQVVLVTMRDGATIDKPGPLGLRQIPRPSLANDLPRLLAHLYPDAPTSTPHPRPPLQTIKVALVGDSSVGKTTLMFRLRTGKFRDLRALTIGVDFHSYQVDLDDASYRMVVWDLGGQDRFRTLRRSFYRGSQVIALMFDASNHATFFDLPRIYREIREELGDITLMLVGNKIDLPREVEREEAEALAEAWQVPYIEISCQSGENVHNLFVELAKYALKKEKTNSSSV